MIKTGFKEYKKNIFNKLINKQIKVKEDLSDYDMAVSYVIACENARGNLNLSPAEIISLIPAYCGYVPFEFEVFWVPSGMNNVENIIKRQVVV